MNNYLRINMTAALLLTAAWTLNPAHAADAGTDTSPDALKKLNQAITEQTGELFVKQRSLQEELEALAAERKKLDEREKQLATYLVDHERTLDAQRRSLEDFERQLSEQKRAYAEQRQRYEEIRGRFGGRSGNEAITKR